MTTTFRLRLGVLIAGIVCVAGLTLWGVQHSGRRIADLEHQLSSGQIESFRLAGEVQQRLLNLNNAMVRYTALREPGMWSEFERASKELDVWIDQYDTRLNHTSTLSTDQERTLIKQLNDAFGGYYASALQVHTNQQAALVSAKGFEQLKEFEDETQGLLQLGTQLGNAHLKAEEFFLNDAAHSLANLRLFLAGGLAIMLALVGALGSVIYRDQIAPLRTRLVQSEAILEKQEKLATLGTLAAGIAHEIRNPLTSIKARLYTLDKHLESPTLARNDSEIIGTEIARLERIVQAVLSFARPSDPELKTIDARALLSEVLALVASSLESRAVHILLEPGPAHFISADAGLLKQVLINLVRNSADSIDGEGTITLRVRSGNAELHGHSMETVIIEVTDSGRGIPAEVEKRLFDPFFSTKETGTGLGLSIAARIVEKHGGNLQYQTRVGHGTTFGIVLPPVAAPLKPSPGVMSSAPA